MLVEAFPAAQLKAWELPHTSYSSAEDRPARQAIVSHLERVRRLDISPQDRKKMLDSADALDAVIAAFAGRAAANRQLKLDKPASWKTEGAIAVHE
jgi:hypothetical protein